MKKIVFKLFLFSWWGGLNTQNNPQNTFLETRGVVPLPDNTAVIEFSFSVKQLSNGRKVNQGVNPVVVCTLAEEFSPCL